MTRALVISPIVINPEKVTLFGGDELIQSIRFGALYWDWLHVTSFRFFQPEALTRELRIGEDLGFVESNVIWKDEIHFDDDLDIVIDLVSEILKERLNKKGEICSLFELGESDLFSCLPIGSDRVSSRRILQVEILKSIPIPLDSVPLEDIRRFRERRRDELEELHSLIFSVAAKYAEIENLEEGIVLASNEIRLATAKLERLMSESGWARLRKSIRINLSGAVIDALPFAGAMGVASFGLGSVVPLVSAAGYGLLKAVVKDVSIKPKVPSELSALTYALAAKNEFEN